jgi:hypothetical protein
MVVVDTEREREREYKGKDSEEFNTGPLWKLRSRNRTWAGGSGHKRPKSPSSLHIPAAEFGGGGGGRGGEAGGKRELGFWERILTRAIRACQ